jgi:hypothetical protein
MLLYFPHMHPEWLAPEALAALPPTLRFLDPGLGRGENPVHLLPPQAPFERSQARALLADTLRFGQTVASPRDLVAQGVMQEASTIAAESANKVLAEVERSLSGQEPVLAEAEDPRLKARQKAQMVLLLAWSQEESLLELRGIGKKLDASWARLDESVGQGDAVVEDAADVETMELDRVLSGMDPLDALPEALPWRKLLEPYALLAPEASLVTLEQGIAADLREAGIPCLAAVPAEIPAGAQSFRAPLWKLLGQSHLPEAKPWQAAEFTLTVLPG